MPRIQNRLPVNDQIRQLELDIRLPRQFLLNLMRHRGFALIVSAMVVLLSSALIHPHLLFVGVPAFAVLMASGVSAVQKQRKRGGVASPLNLITLVQDRDALMRSRPRKTSRQNSH